MTTMTLPSASDYNEAVQAPSRAFRDPELRACKVEQNPLGLPRPRSGGFAITYHLLNHREWAVRCFYRPLRDLDQRYAAIARYLQQHPSSHFVRFEYQPEGVNVRGAWYPIVKMEWVDGKTMGLFVENHYRDSAKIAQIRRGFVDLILQLEQRGVAHGDLQHGNIIVQSTGRLVLVDYDGMYVPGMQMSTSNEIGHPNYQHPGRTNNHFGPWIDRFSAAAIYTSLVFIERDPQLFDRYHNAENLLFTSEDYADPVRSDLFRELERRWGNDHLFVTFRGLISLPVDQLPTFADFINGQLAAPTVQAHARATGATSPSVHQYHGQLLGAVPRRPYALLSATEVTELLARDGQVVEVIGEVVDTYTGRTKFGDPYMFINFGDWKSGCFYIVLWQDILDDFYSRGVNPNEWRGKWVAVTGMLTSYVRSGMVSPQIQLERASQVRILQGEEEAKLLLTTNAANIFSAVPGPAATVVTRRNRDLLYSSGVGVQQGTVGAARQLGWSQGTTSLQSQAGRGTAGPHGLAGAPQGVGRSVPGNRDLLRGVRQTGSGTTLASGKQPSTKRRRRLVAGVLILSVIIVAKVVDTCRGQETGSLGASVSTPVALREARSVVTTAAAAAAPPIVERSPVSSPPAVTPRPWVATVAGDWIVTDAIRAGPGAGTQVTFRVRLTQTGAQVTGTGDLTLSGQLEGATLRATYTHPTGSGEVVWSFSADGTGFTGTFTSSLGNRGDSLGRRWTAASPWQVVSLFYTLLSNHRYEDAYALLSPRFQAQLP
jgi:hypothetical protein